MDPPDPNRTRNISGGDPFPIGRVASNGGRVSVISVDLDFKGAVQVANNDGSSIGVENGIRFRVAGDKDTPTSLRGRDACVGFRQLRHSQPCAEVKIAVIEREMKWEESGRCHRGFAREER